MMDTYFTAPGAWDGGEFGISMFLGRVDPRYAREFLSALWTLPHIEGCWLDKTKEPDEASRLRPTDIDLDDPPRPGGALFGLVELPNGCRCPCASFVMDDDDGFWVEFSMPIVSLGRCYPVGAYPFDDGSDLTWVGELSEWLADIGRGLYAEKPLMAAVVGHVTMVENRAVLEIISGEVPSKRWDGYLLPEGAELKWYAPNVSSAPWTDIRPLRRSFWARFSGALRSKWTKRGHEIQK
jgi:hypothetical protein